MMLPLVILGILILWNVFWFIWKYNTLVATRNEVTNAWNQIDVQLKRRHDLIPNIVSSIKGSMEFEQDTLRVVMEARSAATGARSLNESAKCEGELSNALSRLLAVTENYPEPESERKRSAINAGIIRHGKYDRICTAVL